MSSALALDCGVEKECKRQESSLPQKPPSIFRVVAIGPIYSSLRFIVVFHCRISLGLARMSNHEGIPTFSKIYLWSSSLLGALQRERSQGSAKRPQDPLKTENTKKENYNHVTTTNKCRNANSQIVHLWKSKMNPVIMSHTQDQQSKRPNSS